MTDNELIVLFRTALLVGLNANGLSDVIVKQAYQPTQQGAETGRTLYFNKILDKPHGFSAKEFKDDGFSSQIEIDTRQIYESTFQFDAIARQDPSNPGLTSQDLAIIAAEILGSDPLLDTLTLQDVGVLRVTSVQSKWFIDDRGQHESASMFDVIFTYPRTYSENVGIITEQELNIYEL